MAVLALTRHSEPGPSSRIRLLQYVPHLRARGLDVEALPLLPPGYLEALYAGRRRPLPGIVGGYGRRLQRLLKPYTTLWVEKELLPWVPHFLERLWYRRSARMVVDCDDAVWLRYQLHGNPAVRALLGGKIAAVLRAADVVTAGNTWLQEYAASAGARRTELLPSVVDIDRYPVRAHTAGERFTIGWVGSPSNARYLDLVVPALAELGRRRPVRFTCVGVPAPQIAGVETVTLPWSQETEARDIAGFDAGIMPLPEGPWERGKCGFKLIQYMACGVPAVASATGANPEIIEDGVSGLLVHAADAWLPVLERLVDDAALRERLALQGRRRVQHHYTVQSRLDQLASILGG